MATSFKELFANPERVINIKEKTSYRKLTPIEERAIHGGSITGTLILITTVLSVGFSIYQTFSNNSAKTSYSLKSEIAGKIKGSITSGGSDNPNTAALTSLSKEIGKNDRFISEFYEN